jgi:hypothetical protein
MGSLPHPPRTQVESLVESPVNAKICRKYQIQPDTRGEKGIKDPIQQILARRSNQKDGACAGAVEIRKKGGEEKRKRERKY